MATLGLNYINHQEMEWQVSELAYSANTYDKFVFYVWQVVDGEYFEVINTTCRPSSSWATDTTYDFPYLYYTDELGNNILTPGCSYVTTVMCYHGGEPYTLNYCSFSLPKISPPSGTFTPSVYSAIREQTVGSCVAQTLAAAMDTFKLRVTDGVTYQYSSAYIFGSDGRSSDGMTPGDAIALCQKYGSPRYEIAEGFFSNGQYDELTKANSIKLFQTIENGGSFERDNARKQCFGRYDNIDFYDCEGIYNCLKSGGLFLMGMRTPSNMYEYYDSSGIIPQPDTYIGANHTVLIIGSTIKNNKLHWIVQNSWGDWWGDAGLCYIPYDWGCGVKPPVASAAYNAITEDNMVSSSPGTPMEPTDFADSGSWTTGCYAIYPGKGYTNSNPSAPYDIKCRQVGKEKKINVEWNSKIEADTYIIFARPSSYSQLYKKDDTIYMTDEISVDDYRTYYINILSYQNGYLSKLSDDVRITIYERLMPARDWSWSDIQPGVHVNAISRTRWNNFRTRILNWLRYKEMDNDVLKTTKYGTASTLEDLLGDMFILSTDKTLYANKFNIATYVIKQMNPDHDISFTDRSPGDKVYAYYFHELADALNSIPE